MGRGNCSEVLQWYGSVTRLGAWTKACHVRARQDIPRLAGRSQVNIRTVNLRSWRLEGRGFLQ